MGDDALSSASAKEQTASSTVFRLHLRSQVQTGNCWTESATTADVLSSRIAIVLCDVWDQHWCRGASERLNGMVARMNQVVDQARSRGTRIVHAPSETMAFYDNTTQRQRIRALPSVQPPVPRNIIDPRLPIDDSDGGCDSGERDDLPGPIGTPRHPWTRQHPAIDIFDGDVISDSGHEIYRFLRHHGIERLIFMGVHTNMCVLNRSFGIKQMTRWGVPCVLVRDLTDAMYNPRMPPYVSHTVGTALVVQYIEKYWCPTILSDDLCTT